MKFGRDLNDLAQEITRQNDAKRDFVASTATIEAQPTDTGIEIAIGDKGSYPVGDIAHGQIAAHTKIPMPYYNRMRTESPELLADNVNHWFNDNPQVRLNRTLDGRMRAFLSDRYQCFDNYDFASAALVTMQQRKLQPMSCEVTERKLYLKFVDEKLFKDVPVGHKMGDGSHTIFDTVAPAVIMSNSEVGFGRLTIETGVFTRACTNLALFSSGGMTRRHVGARHQLTENFGVDDLEEVLTNQTKQKMLEALWMQARDVIASAFDMGVFDKRLEQMAATAKNALPAKKVNEVLELVQDKYTLTENEKGGVLEHLLAGGALNQYGLANAITRSAQDIDEYDRATEMEYLGGKILELPRAEWQQLVDA